MHIITFIAVLFVALGMLYIGAKVFAHSFVALAKLFQRFGLFLWNNLPVASIGLFLKNRLVEPAMRSLKAVITKNVAKANKPKATVVFEPQAFNVPRIDFELAYPDLDVPAYLRKGTQIVW
ncbi:hypothetical protein ACSZNZ_18175 [Aeromonas caviae]|uniref:hypothetical protein n=1 Tax=Aeromonas caviae TaxID=648 RepID=UPI0037CEB610